MFFPPVTTIAPGMKQAERCRLARTIRPNLTSICSTGWHPGQHESEGQLLRQCCHGERAPMSILPPRWRSPTSPEQE